MQRTQRSIKAATSKAYPQVRRIGSEDPSAVYLDLGCFVGTDVRKLVADGWNPERVIGSDLRAGESGIVIPSLAYRR